jgi:hypothetical protein
MDPAKERHQISCESRKKCDGHPGSDYTESPNSPRRKKARGEKRQVKSMLIIVLTEGLFTGNSSRQVKQSNLNTAMTFYGDCVQMCEDFDPNFSDIRTGCCPHTYMRSVAFGPTHAST